MQTENQTIPHLGVNINLSDGRKKYCINGDENRAFYTNLTDDEMSYRVSLVPKVLNEYANQLEDRLKSGEIDEREARHLLDVKSKEQVDYVFDADVSSVVFGNLSVSAIGNRKTGETLLELFFEAMFPHLEKEMKKAAKQMQDSEKRILRYTQKYIQNKK